VPTLPVIHIAKACASFVFPDPDNPVSRISLLVRQLARNLARMFFENLRFADSRPLIKWVKRFERSDSIFASEELTCVVRSPI
jgi:hypothetical protein